MSSHDSIWVKLHELWQHLPLRAQGVLADIEHVRKRDYLAIAITLLLGLVTRGAVFWMFNRRVVRRVHQLEENVRSLGKPGALPNAQSELHDDIEQLEQALAEAHTRLKPVA